MSRSPGSRCAETYLPIVIERHLQIISAIFGLFWDYSQFLEIRYPLSVGNASALNAENAALPGAHVLHTNLSNAKAREREANGRNLALLESVS